VQTCERDGHDEGDSGAAPRVCESSIGEDAVRLCEVRQLRFFPRLGGSTVHGPDLARGPVTVTTPEMTRFVLDLRQASSALFSALRDARPGETHVPKAPSARVLDIAKILINGRDIPIIFTGIRPAKSS